MIRTATADDLPEMIALLIKCYNEMSFKTDGYSFDNDSVATTLQTTINGNGFVLVVGLNRIEGIFAAFKVPSIMDYNDIKMIEFIFHTDPSLSFFKRAKLSKQLLDEAVNITRKYGVKTLHVSSSLSNKDATIFLERQGFKPREVACIKGV